MVSCCHARRHLTSTVSAADDLSLDDGGYLTEMDLQCKSTNPYSQFPWPDFHFPMSFEIPLMTVIGNSAYMNVDAIRYVKLPSRSTNLHVFHNEANCRPRSTHATRKL